MLYWQGFDSVNGISILSNVAVKRFVAFGYCHWSDHVEMMLEISYLMNCNRAYCVLLIGIPSERVNGKHEL